MDKKSNKRAPDLAGLVHRYAGEMLSWAAYKVSDVETAKDLVQETFLAAAEKFDRFRGDSSPKTWLYSILNNKIIDFYRKKIKQPVSGEAGMFSSFFDENGEWRRNKRPRDWNEEEDHLLDNSHFNDILQQCLDALPEQWNLAVKLKFLSGKKGEEICEMLGISPANYWQIVRRAKLRLRACIEENWFEKQ